MKKSPGKFITDHRTAIIVIFAVLLGLSVFSTMNITINTQFKDLLKEDNERGLAFQKVLENFRTTSTVIAAVEGNNIREMINAAEELAEAVRENEYLNSKTQAIQLKADPELIRRWGLQLADSETIQMIKIMMDPMMIRVLFVLLIASTSGIYCQTIPKKD